MSEPLFFSDREVREVLFMLGYRSQEMLYGDDTNSYRVAKAVRDAMEKKLTETLSQEPEKTTEEVNKTWYETVYEIGEGEHKGRRGTVELYVQNNRVFAKPPVWQEP